jgi:hypothetical protein
MGNKRYVKYIQTPQYLLNKSFLAKFLAQRTEKEEYTNYWACKTCRMCHTLKITYRVKSNFQEQDNIHLRLLNTELKSQLSMFNVSSHIELGLCITKTEVLLRLESINI